jgi:hypothetical protein
MAYYKDLREYLRALEFAGLLMMILIQMILRWLFLPFPIVFSPTVMLAS